MAHTRLRLVSGCSIAFALLLGSGCAKDDEPGNDGDDSSGSADDATVSVTGTDDGMTSGPDTLDTGSMSVGDSSGGTAATFEESGTTEPPMPQPNGGMCDDDAGCESMHCFVVGPLGGICGECTVDADCADTTMGGCTIPNPLSQPPQGSTCNMGEHGAGCMTSDVCAVAEDICAVIIDVPGIITVSSCSQCTMDSDCMDGDLCSPSYDLVNISGSKDCVMPGSVANGGGCDQLGSGDMACMSGICAEADIMGFIQLGVCSECEIDTDCDAMEMCEPASADLTGLIAGTCVPV